MNLLFLHCRKRIKGSRRTVYSRNNGQNTSTWCGYIYVGMCNQPWLEPEVCCSGIRNI